MNILNELFDIGIAITVHKSAPSDDEERYLKMMMKIDPNDPGVFERNTNQISYRIQGYTVRDQPILVRGSLIVFMTVLALKAFQDIVGNGIVPVGPNG